jgi:ATP-binding cassette subfamily B protein
LAQATALEWSRYVEDGAFHLGLSAEAAGGQTGVQALLAEGGPVLLALRARDGGRGFAVLLASRGQQIEVVGPDGRNALVDAQALDEVLTVTGQAEDDRLLSFCRAAGLDDVESDRARNVLGPAAGARAVLAWHLAAAAPSLWRRLAEARVGRLVASTLASHLAGFFLLIVSWWLLGATALNGHLQRGWLWAWVLFQLTFVLCRASGLWGAGRLAIHLGGLVRERLLEGILHFPPDQVRAKGIGRLLGTVLEADGLDALARTGGPVVLADLFQFSAGAVVLALGAAPLVHLALLAGWLVVAGVSIRRHARRLNEWADSRLACTDQLVESMVGHRTRAAQENPDARQLEDERGLADYAERSRTCDDETARLAVLVPRGWLLLGIAGLAPAFALRGSNNAGLAVSLGGVMLTYLAFRRLALTTGPSLAAAWVAWRQVRPLFYAPVEDVAPEPVAVLPSELDDAETGRRALLVGRDLSYLYPGRLEPVLRRCSFEIHRGDRVLLEGRSGSGKSTLAALACGLRSPSSGLLLLGGFDQHSLRPQRWRERVAAVPQSHENHLLSAPLLFNIGMARTWPLRPGDEEAIEEICRELGLGDLIERMPAGLQQMVGDSGWQLSHGERSRVCVARVLFQRADVRVLDESLAALDPETLDRVLECVLRRSETLVVISHA